MIRIADETPEMAGEREALLDACFGGDRFAKTCERLRDGRLPARGLSLAAVNGGRLVGTVRLWNVAAGIGREALLLGPLAVAESQQGRGIGGELMRVALSKAEGLGYGSVLLVGDASYYRRFGFSTGPTQALWLPGPVERERFLGLELKPEALVRACGMVRATGERIMPEDVWARMKMLMAG
ncbi:MAG: GNAT family N-acetyltransferase [Beijerinckiaceae bacterium]